MCNEILFLFLLSNVNKLFPYSSYSEFIAQLFPLQVVIQTRGNNFQIWRQQVITNLLKNFLVTTSVPIKMTVHSVNELKYIPDNVCGNVL